jgi:hypothetical protein
VLDNGADQAIVLVVTGALADRTPLPPVRIPADQFAAMNWIIPRWGTRAVMYAGVGARDHLRAAIPLLSGDIERSTIYTHTGWRETDSGWVYLHAGGSIGAAGPRTDLRVRLPHALSHFDLPAPPTGAALVQAVQASLRMLDLAPDTVTVPLYAAIWRAALGESAFSLHLEGPTGARKTALATLAQQHYGARMHAGALPAGWESTANALEALAFQAKDALLVVDDFAPHGGAGAVQRLHREADRVLRAQANQTGRQRLGPDALLRPARMPRGLIVSTGEEIPYGQSLRARLLVLELGHGTVDLASLTNCQHDAAAGGYAQAMAGYVHWVAGRYTSVQATVHAAAETRRQQVARPGMHGRTPESVAHLVVGMETFLTFAVEVGAVSEADAAALRRRTAAALEHVAAAQAGFQAGSEPTHQFLALLAAALATGRAFVADIHGGAPTDPSAWGWRAQQIRTGASAQDEWQPLGAKVGWVEGTDLYLEPDAAYGAVQALGQHAGHALSISAQTLRKRLHEHGLLASIDATREVLTVRRTLEGQRRDVLHLRIAALFPANT